MKTTKILGATTLAGALLFTGFSNADAAQTVNDSNVKSYAEQAIGAKYTSAGKVTVTNDFKDKGDYYEVYFHGEKDNGVGPAKVYKNGKVTGVDPQHGPGHETVYAEAQQQNTQDNSENSQATDNTVNTQNNEQQTQATDNNVATQNNQQTTQSDAKALPATGEQSTNTGLVASIATLLLAVGSALTFKRFSKNNK